MDAEKKAGVMKVVLAVISLLVLAWASLIGWSGLINAHRIVAGPDNQTGLYRNYNPERVIKQFRYKGEGYSWGEGAGATQLVNSISQQRDFAPRFTMRADQEAELMNALRADIMVGLRTSGMTVTATHDDADGGFTYKYISGSSVGTISAQAPVHQAKERPNPLPDGTVDVEVNISLQETWTRPMNERSWWMAAVD